MLHLDHVYKKLINDILIDNAEYLDIVMPIYNLLEYSENYSITSGSLWRYCRDEVKSDENEHNDAGNYKISNNKTKTIKSFEYNNYRSKEFLDIQATIECGFTLKRVRNMIRSNNLEVTLELTFTSVRSSEIRLTIT